MSRKKTIYTEGEMFNPPHPGEVLKEMHLDPLGLTVTEAARRLNIDRKTLSRVINGQSAVSVDMALRLSKGLNTSAQVWLGMQQAYDLWQTKLEADLSEVQGLHTVIVKNSKGKVIADYPVFVSGLNYQTKAKEYFEEARQNLIEDGIVSRKELNDLSYELR